MGRTLWEIPKIAENTLSKQCTLQALGSGSENLLSIQRGVWGLISSSACVTAA